MIFQSLVSLYGRLKVANEVPPYGFSIENIGFAITIDGAGNLVGEPEDQRVKLKTNTYNFRKSVLPYTNQVGVRSGNASTTPNFMCDKADYIFGMSGNSKKEVYHKSFKTRIYEVCGESSDEGVLAVKAFLAQWVPEKAADLRNWKEICGMHGKCVAFQLQGEVGFVHERPEVKKLWSDFVAKENFSKGVSFLDGGVHAIQPQYAQFSFGSGASLVSFNETAYESYGKQKGANAPLSADAEFESSAALKFLLRSKTQRIRIGDAHTLFWAERATPLETFFGQILNPAVGDSDKAAAVPVKEFLKSIRKGAKPQEIDYESLKFYILGLSLNKARLAVRFWYVSTVGDVMARLCDHFDHLNIEMEKPEKDPPFPGVWHLLKETARETKNISPVLGGALSRAILTGGNYPQNLYHGVLGRIRADHRVNYLRSAIIKAVLQRNFGKEIPVSLDKERKDTAYLLGRLFAVLEKAQRDALGKINSTIKDRFFSAASATPASVFPRLIRLSQHHIAKAEYGQASDRRISEIVEHLNMFPAHMNLQEQGVFSIAYYHQKNALYKKNETT